jgi:hypothetical protein
MLRFFQDSVSSLGNGYPDRLFHCARRLLHRIALNDRSRGGDPHVSIRIWIRVIDGAIGGRAGDKNLSDGP